MHTSQSSSRAHKTLPALLVFATGLLSAGSAAGQAVAQSPAPLHEYAVKFVCGRAVNTTAAPSPVALGSYFTDINVHNPNGGSVEFRKKFARALPNQKPGPVTQFFPAALKPDEAFAVECAEITKKLNLAPLSFVIGFAVFQSARELDVVAVYTTAANSSSPVSTMHVERIPKRP